MSRGHRMFPRPRAKNVIADLPPSKKNENLPIEEREYGGKTVSERIEEYCNRCKNDPCTSDCVFFRRKDLSAIKQFCQQCQARQGTGECKSWSCPLRPCAP